MITFRSIRSVASLVLVAALAACTDGTTPSGTPSRLRKVAGDSQPANVAIAVARPPQVQVLDAGGAPVANAWVTFAPADTASGTVTGGRARSDRNGIASPIGWNLGRRAVVQRLVARVEGASDSAVFLVRPRAQGALRVVAASDTTFSARAFDTLAAPLRVRVVDLFDNPVAGDSVAFIVDTSTFGRLNSSFIGAASAVRVPTDSAGFASVSVRIGRRAGAHRVTATLAGTQSPGLQVVFRGTAVPSTPAVMQVAPSACFAIPRGAAVPTATLPVATIRDAFDNPTPGATVDFTIVSDVGGVLTGASVLTDADGRARVGGWTTGTGAGRKSIRATVRGTTVTEVATGIADGSAFCIDVVYTAPPTPSIRAAFDRAADRWAEVIVGPLAPVLLNIPNVTTCVGATIQPGTYDIPNVRIYASIVPIDGVGAVLGSAGPCFYRGTTSGIVRPGELTIIGGMRFDSDDLQNLVANGTLGDVILHEMGHVLGLGTYWNSMGFLTNPPQSPCNNRSLDTRYVGVNAVREFAAAGGPPSTPAPVENTNGCGTAGGHWQENSQGAQPGDRVAIGLNTELMTGFSEPGGVAMPLSRITIGSLQDMGYTVSYAAADPYTMPLSILMPGTVAQQLAHGVKVRLVEEPVAPPRAVRRIPGSRAVTPY